MHLLNKLNYSLIIIPLMIFSLGLVTLFASAPQKATSQLIFFGIGLLLYVGALLIDYDITRVFWKYILGFSTVLLLLVELVGVAKLGSSRWLDVGLLTFQPSELAKLAIIISLAGYITSHPDFGATTKNLFKFLFIVIPLIVLTFLQPDLGTTIVLAGTLLIVLFYSGLNKLYFLSAFIISGLLSSPIWNILKDYQKIRIMVFLNPQSDVLGHGYNVIQSIISIGSGGLLGKGFAHGSQTQMEFLPVHWTDFIFASFAEEWGFVGVMLLVVLYFLFLGALLHLSINVKDSYGSLLVIGVFSIFFMQFLINVGMNLGLMPVTGITLPLVSHGGSSLVVTMAMLGLVQNVAIRSRA